MLAGLTVTLPAAPARTEKEVPFEMTFTVGVATVPVEADGVAAPVPTMRALFALSHVKFELAASWLLPLLYCTWPVVPAGMALPPEPPMTRHAPVAPLLLVAVASYCRMTALLEATLRLVPVPVTIWFATVVSDAFWFASVRVLFDPLCR